MKKLCVVDMNFTWPPDGGASVDFDGVLEKYAEGFEVILLVPRVVRSTQKIAPISWVLGKTDFFKRGKIDEDSGRKYRVEFINYKLQSFSPLNVCNDIRKMVEEIKPDHVMVGGGFYFKPEIILALKEFKPVLFLFAHEMICLKGSGVMARKNQECHNTYLDGTDKSRNTCLRCISLFYITYPSPRWLFEIWRTKAFGASYQQKCIGAYQAAGKVVVRSNRIAKLIESYVVKPPIVVPPMISIQKINTDKEKKVNIKIRFLFTGRTTDRGKGKNVVLQAAKKLWSRRQDFEIICTGLSSKYTVDRPYLSMTPWVSHDQMDSLYESVDVLLMPSVWPESFGLVAQEAMSYGVMPIVTSITGVSEHLESGENGWVIPPNDVSALLEKMFWCCENRDQVKRMGIKARETTQHKFDSTFIFKKFYEPLFQETF